MLFAGYKNIVVSPRAVENMIQKIHKLCRPAVVARSGSRGCCRVQLRAQTWNSLVQNIVNSMEITMGSGLEKKESEALDESRIDEYFCNHISE